MIKESDKVIIKKTGIRGEVVDIYVAGGQKYYIVESDERGVPGGDGPDDGYKLFHCLAGEIKDVFRNDVT